MSMVIVGSKAFDLANVVLLELREPHGEDRHPYVVATLHNGQTIEVTSPLDSRQQVARHVLTALVGLLAQGSFNGARRIVDTGVTPIRETENGILSIELDGRRLALIGMYGEYCKGVYEPPDLGALILVGRQEVMDGHFCFNLQPEETDS